MVVMHPITERFGAEIGLDARGPFDVDDIALVEAALNRFSVLVFPEQELGNLRQMEFAAHFGPLETDTGVIRTGVKRLADLRNRIVHTG